MKDRKVDRFLRMHENTVVMNSESSDSEGFDFEVQKGYFSSSDDDAQKKKVKDAE